jgi:hypothetical protein
MHSHHVIVASKLWLGGILLTAFLLVVLRKWVGGNVVFDG